MSQRILVLFAHPALEKSRVNQLMVEAVRDLNGVTFHDLYEAYPDFFIDVKREQQLLVDHDIYVLQHPFFWYSTPAIIKQWEDLVLEHGWAYGSEGTKLRGKQLMSAVTTGGRKVAYQHGGYNRFTVRELLTPIEQTAFLCGIDYLPPYIAYGAHSMTTNDISMHADEYRQVIVALRDGTLDLDKVRQYERINEQLDEVIRTTVGAD